MFFWFQGGLAAGQSIWVQVDADGYDLWAGNFYAWVDHTNSIAESNEAMVTLCSRAQSSALL